MTIYIITRSKTTHIFSVDFLFTESNITEDNNVSFFHIDFHGHICSTYLKPRSRNDEGS